MNRNWMWIAGVAVMAGGLAISGCGRDPLASGSPIPTPLPPSGPSATSNLYVGTQSPGYWTLSLDDTQQAFSYAPLTYATSQPVSGNFVTHEGILDFGLANGKSAGIAIELPGQAAVVRPGDDTVAPVAMAQQGGCFALTGRTRFLFTSIPVLQPNVTNGYLYVGYGGVVASTSADGKSWQFGDLREYELTSYGSQGVAPGTQDSLDPLSFTATCAVSNGRATITADANAAFTTLPTFKINESGNFIEDRSPAAYPTVPDSTSYGWVGLVEPSSKLAAKDVAAVAYSGILYEPVPGSTVATQPVAFSPIQGVSGGLIGGTFPGEDLTKAAGTQFTIALGKPDSVLNGVFPTASLTLPDANNNCPLVAAAQNGVVKAGFDVNGNPICTAEGVAIVGNQSGKFVMYFTALDGTVSPYNPYKLQMYLYQH